MIYHTLDGVKKYRVSGYASWKDTNHPKDIIAEWLDEHIPQIEGYDGDRRNWWINFKGWVSKRDKREASFVMTVTFLEEEDAMLFKMVWG